SPLTYILLDLHSSDVFFLVLFHALFFLHATPPTEIYTLSLHDALPISASRTMPETRSRSSSLPLSTIRISAPNSIAARASSAMRSEEHTSELQSRENLVCRLLLEKKKKNIQYCNAIIRQLNRQPDTAVQ